MIEDTCRYMQMSNVGQDSPNPSELSKKNHQSDTKVHQVPKNQICFSFMRHTEQLLLSVRADINLPTMLHIFFHTAPTMFLDLNKSQMYDPSCIFVADKSFLTSVQNLLSQI
jgi:hypothetical protein